MSEVFCHLVTPRLLEALPSGAQDGTAVSRERAALVEE